MIFGYLDPITSSAIMQVILGALAVVGLGWQYIRRGTRSLWSTLRSGDRQENNPPGESNEVETTV